MLGGWSYQFNVCLRIAHRCSIGFRSGDWDGKGKRVKHCWKNHSISIFVVCTGALSCWKKIEEGSKWNLWIVWNKFYSKISRYWCWFMRASTLHTTPGPWIDILPQIIILPLPCITVWETVQDESCYESRIQHQDIPSEQKRLILDSSEKITQLQSFIVQCWCAIANSKRSLIFFLESWGFFSFTCALKPCLQRARLTIFALTCTLKFFFQLPICICCSTYFSSSDL